MPNLNFDGEIWNHWLWGLNRNFWNFLMTNYLFFQQPGVALKHTKEGTESSAFWFALGGKQSYTSKKVIQDIVSDPHLYTISYVKGWSHFLSEAYFVFPCVAFDIIIYMWIYIFIAESDVFILFIWWFSRKPWGMQLILHSMNIWCFKLFTSQLLILFIDSPSLL